MCAIGASRAVVGLSPLPPPVSVDIADSSRHRRPFRPPVRNISLLFVSNKIIGNIKAVYGSYFSGGQ